MGYQWNEYENLDLSVAMSEAIHIELTSHFRKGRDQEDLTFGYWNPSRGATRFTAILNQLLLPDEGERILQGNVAFTSPYLLRALRECPKGSGIALLHSHLGPGWQNMSTDDVVAERDRLGGAVAASTDLPVIGLTYGTDGTWSARSWTRAGARDYRRSWAHSVRVVGHSLRFSFHPELEPQVVVPPSQVATVSVWGESTQSKIARTRVAIVGLGSVGSILNEALARMGVQRITLIDHDVIETRNLDRTLGATSGDVLRKAHKVEIAERNFRQSATSLSVSVNALPVSILSEEGIAAALDCDVLFSCVDRPLPRHLLNVISYGHLIPVIDGGILAKVDEYGNPLHVDWRIHTVGPSKECLVCLGALVRSDVALDRDGKLDDSDYIKNLSRNDKERYSRRNVFPFSLSVAAHEALHFVGLIGGGERIAGIGPQMYHAYPGEMKVSRASLCDSDCEYNALLASAPTALEMGIAPAQGQTNSKEQDNEPKPRGPVKVRNRLGRRLLE